MYYRSKDVDRLARDIKALIVYRRNRPTKFEQVKTREEMEECLKISQALFGVGKDLLDENMEVLEKNPETYYLLRDEDQIIGFTIIWPIKQGKINNILSQTLPVKALPEDIEVFERGKCVDIYIATVGIKPVFSKAEKHSYGARLISGLIETIVSLGKREIPIGIIAARSNMPEGIRLMRGIGFTEIKPLTPERRTFVINVKESGIPFIQEYQQALNGKSCSGTTTT